MAPPFVVLDGCVSEVDSGGQEKGEPRMVTLVAVRPTIVRVSGFGSGIEPGSAAPACIFPMGSIALGGELGHLMKGRDETGLA